MLQCTCCNVCDAKYKSDEAIRLTWGTTWSNKIYLKPKSGLCLQRLQLTWVRLQGWTLFDLFLFWVTLPDVVTYSVVPKGCDLSHSFLAQCTSLHTYLYFSSWPDGSEGVAVNHVQSSEQDTSRAVSLWADIRVSFPNKFPWISLFSAHFVPCSQTNWYADIWPKADILNVAV